MAGSSGNLREEDAVASDDVAVAVDGSVVPASRSLSRASASGATGQLEEPLLSGWQRRGDQPSLAESHMTISFPDTQAPLYKKAAAFLGVGFLVSVGYSDPGNWATDLAAGSEFGYSLLFVVLVSSITAMFLQYLSLKLGISSDRDLAQACRDAYHPKVTYVLWALAELGIAAMDLAEVLGSAIALYLLTGMPLWAGVLVTASDVLIMMFLELRNFRALEVFVVILSFVICGCFVYELAVSKPDMGKVMAGFLPKPKILTDQKMLYIATGILGATVMPHNLYLHSSVVQTRKYPRTAEGKSLAVRLGAVDTVFSLTFALFINAAILVLSAAAFYYSDPPQKDVSDISDAFKKLAPSLGAKAASILFGVALLASGQNATITGTLAGQIVMEGYLQLKLKPWVRRLLTRGLAIVPAAIVAGILGADGVGRLLVLSQVILSLTLPFTVFPLVHFTSMSKYMGDFVNNWPARIIAWLVFLVIAGLNINLVIRSAISGDFASE